MYNWQFPEMSFTAFALLRQTWLAMNKTMEVKLAKVGLTPEKLAILWACRDYPGVLTPAEIARLVFRENQTIAGLLNRMEKDGLVKRVPKRKGHPFTEVKLTTKGEKAVGPGIEIMRTLVTEFASKLSEEELEELQNLMRPMRDKALEKLYLEAGTPPGFRPGQVVPVKW